MLVSSTNTLLRAKDSFPCPSYSSLRDSLQPNLEASEGAKYWDLIRLLHQEGWEIASHTINHYNLPEVDTAVLRRELFESSQRIEQAIGTAPITLILPFGDVWRGNQYPEKDKRIFEIAKETGYKFVVGIGEGRNIDEDIPYYFGRVVPDINASVTLQRLKRFNTK